MVFNTAMIVHFCILFHRCMYTYVCTYVYSRHFHVMKTTNNRGNQAESHIYDEVGMYAKPSTVCKSQSTLTTNSKGENVIFEGSISQMPAYYSLTKKLDENCNKPRNEKYNDYYIDGDDNSKPIESIYEEEEEGKYITNDLEKELESDHAYNKLVHLKQ